MLHTYCRMQLNVMCNWSYATTQIYSCMCRMQLNFNCKQQLQNPKFLVVWEVGIYRSTFLGLAQIILFSLLPNVLEKKLI
jgi:hypothetical protein